MYNNNFISVLYVNVFTLSVSCRLNVKTVSTFCVTRCRLSLFPGKREDRTESLVCEELEVLSTKKIVFEGDVVAVGIDCSMQHKNEIWHGKILSVHGKIHVFFLFLG